MKLKLSIACLLLAACHRASIEEVKIKIQMPDSAQILKTNKLFSLALPAGKKICYGVNVRASDISEAKVCNYNQGVLAGFVDANSILELTVPNGQNRSFQLLAHIVDETVTCSSWAGVNQNRLDWVNLYTAGAVQGVTLDGKDTIVDIPVALNSHSLGFLSGDANCGSAGVQLKAALLENGDIVDDTIVSRFPIDTSMPFLNSISVSLMDIEPLWTYTSTAGMIANRLETASNPTVVGYVQSPHLSSIVRSPNTGATYGALVDGKIVSVNLATGAYSTLSSCPLSSCKIPVWMQSFSIGLGGKVYGLDYGGNIYYISDYLGQPQVISVLNVPSYVSHVVVF